VISHVSRQPRGLNELLTQLIQIGIALSSERDLGVLLERIVAEARHFTNAEAGTLFLREGGALRFAVVQNEPFVQRFGAADTRARVGAGAERLALDLPALADHVAKTGETIVLPRTYGVPDGRPSAFDAPTDDGTRSVLAVPLQEPAGDVVGVLQLINARDEDGEVISDTYWSFRQNNHTDFASLVLANTVTGAASLFDLARGVARSTGIRLSFSPGFGGVRMMSSMSPYSLAASEVRK